MLLRAGGLDVATHSPNARVSLDKAPGGGRCRAVPEACRLLDCVSRVLGAGGPCWISRPGGTGLGK